MKVAVIGLDGATFDLLDPWLTNGKLPNINSLIKRGVKGKLKSVIPPISSAAWVSFMTGKNPGKHGIFDFTIRSDYSYFENKPEERRLISSLSIKDETLWEILSKHKFKVGVVNVPVTYPPKEVNGFMISCFMTPPNAEFTYPRELKNELSGYRIDVKFVMEYFTNPETRELKKSELLKEQYEVTRSRELAVKKLLTKWDLDFFMVVFKGTDNLQHFFWNKKDILEKYYMEMDRIIGDLLELIGENTNVFIISDHGFGPESSKKFYINNWLENVGYLRRKKNIKTKITRLAYNFGSRIVRKLNLRVPKEVARSIVHEVQGNIDWSSTKAFGSRIIPGVRINLQGREPYGIVKKSEYEIVRNDIMSKLKELRDVDGSKIVNEVYRREELYNGPHTEKLPDIVILPNPRYKISPYFGERMITPHSSHYEGDHVNGYIYGILIAAGPDIKQGIEIKEAKIYDIAPTILHIFGLAIPEDMDGRVLKEIFRTDSEPARREIIYQKVSPEEVKIKSKIRKLKKLGKL